MVLLYTREQDTFFADFEIRIKQKRNELYVNNLKK